MRRFSPTLYLRRTDTLELVAERGRSRTWLLSRALCAYTTLDATTIPLRKRSAWAATALARWSPFPDTAYHVEWAGSRAMAWAWSPSGVLELGADDEVPPSRMLPEAVFRGSPRPEGAELLAMAEGYEGRVWKSGVLEASQWWPEVPSTPDWRLFLRGAGLPAPQGVPEPVAPPLALNPWSRESGNAAIGEIASRHRPTLIAAGVGIAAAILVFPLGSSIRLLAATASIEREIASQDEGLQSILSARESAERDAARVESLLSLRPPATQLQLLAKVVELSPGRDWRVLEWRMTARDTLQVDLQMPSPDPKALVERWEASGMFADVTAELGRNSNEVVMRARVIRSAQETPE